MYQNVVRELTYDKIDAYFIVLSIHPLGQDMQGSIGVVTISDHYGHTDHKLEFLNEDGTTWYTLDLYENWENKEDFTIVAFKPDYFLFHIRCLEQTKTHYRVIVNENISLIKTLKKSSKLKFQSWEDYVINVFSVTFDSSSTIIYNEVGGTVIKELPGRESIFVPKEINGEWMKVTWADANEYPSDTSSNQTGWIRWKKDDKIIVMINHLS